METPIPESPGSVAIVETSANHTDLMPQLSVPLKESDSLQDRASSAQVIPLSSMEMPEKESTIGTQPTGFDFDTFLSHNSKDKGLVRDLKRALVSKGITTWFDEDELAPGSLWQTELEQGITSAGSVIVAIGPAGFGRWHIEELQAARLSERPVIPVLLPGGPPGSALDPFLQNRIWVDFRDGVTDEGIRRLIWGITGHRPNATAQEIKSNAEAIRWVLIAGSGRSTPRPPEIGETCAILGVELAKAGLGLVCGGWDGVDHDVARSFARELQKDDAPLSTRLVQVMEQGWRPAFPAGRLHLRKTDAEAWQHSIERADAVLLVGGLGGTYKTGQWALEAGKPVLPIADSPVSRDEKGDAYRFYFETVENWDRNPGCKKLSLDEFGDLAGPAPRVAVTAVRLLKKLLG